jgi:hypothetical protein
MIGVADDPGASVVSIAGWVVWNPELLSLALADAVRTTTARAVASAAVTSLYDFRILVPSPFVGHRGTYTRVRTEATTRKFDPIFGGGS